MADPITQITLGDLVKEIKLEAKLTGSADLDPLVTNLINELLLSYCLKNRYFELLQLNVPFITVAALGQFPLPTDFQHIALVRYRDVQLRTRTLYPRNEFVANPAGTIPKYYQLSANNLTLIPSDGIRDNETLLIDYYSLPPKLTDLADLFPIPRLYVPLKQRAIYRALKYNKVETADSFKSDAAEDEARARPSRG